MYVYIYIYIYNIYIYKIELCKACFQQDMAYGNCKDLPRKVVSNKLLHDKAFRIAINLHYDGYQYGLALVVYKFFDKKSRWTATQAAVRITSEDQKLANELHKSITRNLKRHKNIFILSR